VSESRLDLHPAATFDAEWRAVEDDEEGERLRTT
jgi:hypothetical protein